MKKLLIALIAGMLMIVPAMAMDSISDSDLDGISGQAGVAIVFEGASSQRISFTSIVWTDPDGIGAGSTAGSLYIQSAASQSLNITIAMLTGAKLTLDVATLSAPLVIGTTTIPTAEQVIRVGLPNQTVTVDTPDYFTIGLGNDATGGIDGTLGQLTLTGLSISVTNPTALYVYAK